METAQLRERRIQLLAHVSASIEARYSAGRSSTASAEPVALLISGDNSQSPHVVLVPPSVLRAFIDSEPHGSLQPQIDLLAAGDTKAVPDIPVVLISALVAGMADRSSRYLLEFAPEISAGLQAGTLTLAQARTEGVRAWAVDRTGQIAGHGTLHEVAAGFPVDAVWRLAAEIVGKKYLADFRDELSIVNQAVAGIQTWLEDEQLAELRGIFSFIFDIAMTLTEGGATQADREVWRPALDTCELRCRVIVEHVSVNRERAIAVLRASPAASSEDDAQDARFGKALETYTQLTGVLEIATRARLAAASLRAPVGLGEAHARGLLAAATDERDRILESHRSLFAGTK